MTGPWRARLRTVAALLLRDSLRGVPGRVGIPGLGDFRKNELASTPSRGDCATKRPANRREAGGAPAIGIEARKGRGPAPPGLGAKHESPGPKDIAPPVRKKSRAA